MCVVVRVNSGWLLWKKRSGKLSVAHRGPSAVLESDGWGCEKTRGRAWMDEGLALPLFILGETQCLLLVHFGFLHGARCVNIVMVRGTLQTPSPHR